MCVDISQYITVYFPKLGVIPGNMFDIIKLQCGFQSSSETSVILASPVDKKYSGDIQIG